MTISGSKYSATIRENSKLRHLGTFVTPEEAALCYARHVRARRAAAEAAEARGGGPQPLKADDGQGGVAPLPPKVVARKHASEKIQIGSQCAMSVPTGTSRARIARDRGRAARAASYCDAPLLARAAASPLGYT